MWIRAFFNPARLAPVLCLLCLIFFGFIRPVRALQRAEEAEKPLTYANLQGSWFYTGEKMLFLDTGRVEIRKNRNPHEPPKIFTDKPATDGKRGFFVFKGWRAWYDEWYEIVDSDHILISGKTLYRVELTATTLTLIRRTEAMEFTSFYKRVK